MKRIFLLLLFALGFLHCALAINAEDEPKLAVEEASKPLGEDVKNTIVPVWKHMKDVADQQAENMHIQEAFNSYSQLLTHKHLYGGMPLAARYEVFISMAILLKTMGFHQRAELLLYEATSYTTHPHEAHFHLGLLALDREDLREAAMHFKNCLYYKEDDVLTLTHLTVTLIVEGKFFEAKFFVSRLLSALEIRVRNLLRLMGRDESDLVDITARIENAEVARWLEDVAAKVMHGEYRVTPSSNIEMVRMFSNVYTLIADGQLSGRFEFDLGQGLYEKGCPRTGFLMMQRGYNTSSLARDGKASSQLVRLRLEMDFPIVPTSVTEIIQRYFNMTLYLNDTMQNFSPLDIENILDIYWPIPLFGWAGVSMSEMTKDLLYRFNQVPIRLDPYGQHFLGRESRRRERQTTFSFDTAAAHEQRASPAKRVLPSVETVRGSSQGRKGSEEEAALGTLRSSLGKDYQDDTVDVLVDGRRLRFPKAQVLQSVNPESSVSYLRRLSNEISRLDDIDVILESDSSENDHVIEVGIFGGHMNSHPVGQSVLASLFGFARGHSRIPSASRFRLTLLALPLFPDAATRRIAESVSKIVNLPVDTSAAWAMIESLRLDVLLIPDWQPFPDQHSAIFTSARMAPVQMCYFVRGGGCPSASSIDYYLLPEDFEDSYLKDNPAAASGPPEQGSRFDSDAKANTDYHVIRPAWLEIYAEQVVLVPKWSLFTKHTVRESAERAVSDNAMNPQTQPSSSTTATQTASSDFENANTSANPFMPSDIEGQVVFADNQVAILAIHPSQLHPLMDDVLLKLLNVSPSLHLVLVMPEVYFSYGQQGDEHKICWARSLVRRMWQRGGSLHQRIRLLPSPLTDGRLLQLFKQADFVLDTFPIGSPSHFISLALAAGTPIVTMRCGTQMHTPRVELHALQTWLSTAGHRLSGHPLYSHLQEGLDIPWKTSIGSASAFYAAANLSTELVANSTSEYFAIASRLARDRDFGYQLRIRILDALDSSDGRPQDEGVTSNSDEDESLAGLWDFIHSIGRPWARVRNAFMSSPRAAAVLREYTEANYQGKAKHHPTD